MPPKRAFFANSRAEVRDNSAVEAADSNDGRGKRRKIKTQRAIEGDQLPAGTASQPIELPETQLSAPLLPSPPAEAAVEAAVEAAADPLVGRVIGVAERPWELQVLESQVIAAPSSASKAATEASVDEDQDEVAGGFDAEFTDDYNGINWADLRSYVKPSRTLTGRKSWVFKHGYRVALRRTLAEIAADVPERTFFVCRWCHHNAPTSSVIEVTAATTSSAKHLAANRRGHRIYPRGKQLAGKQPVAKLPGGQSTIIDAMKKGVEVSREVANELSSFNVQGFRLAAVQWLVENNHPLREFETESFRRMLQFANPAAVDALWTSHNSVSRFAMRLYDYLLPIVKAELATAISKVYISFDGWTTKGGKRGFFGVVAHYADAGGKIKDLPIGLPQLAGIHSGEAIRECVNKALAAFGLTAQ